MIERGGHNRIVLIEREVGMRENRCDRESGGHNRTVLIEREVVMRENRCDRERGGRNLHPPLKLHVDPFIQML